MEQRQSLYQRAQAIDLVEYLIQPGSYSSKSKGTGLLVPFTF